jgi:ribokinase
MNRAKRLDLPPDGNACAKNAKVQDLNVVVLGGVAVDQVAEVSQLPRKDSVVLAWSQHTFPGGSAANVAVGLARLGCRTGFVGKVGDDERGRLLSQAFADEGVDTTALIVERGAATASCFIAVDGHGERMIVAFPGAALIETVGELDTDYVAKAQVLYVGPAYPDVAAAAMAAMHQRRGAVVYAPSGAWGPNGLADIQNLLQQTDVLLVSRAEAETLTGLSSPIRAAWALHDAGSPSQSSVPGAPVVIETLGSGGSLVLDQGVIHEAPAFPVSGLRDTTGAGDAFAAGLIAEFLQPPSRFVEGARASTSCIEALDWPAASRQGNAAAAFKIRHLGARNGLPTRRELEQMLGESPK